MIYRLLSCTLHVMSRQLKKQTVIRQDMFSGGEESAVQQRGFRGMRQRYIFDGLEQDTAHSSEQFHSLYLQDHTKSVLEEIGDIKCYETIC